MGFVVSTFFFTLWLVVGFLLLRFAGRRFFHEPRRADVAAAAAAIAFGLGAIWPYSVRLGSTPETGPAAVPQAQHAVAARPAIAGRNTSAACRGIRGTSFAQGNRYGALDAVRSNEPSGSTPVADGGTVDRNTGYYIDGWATDSRLDRPANGVCLLVDGKIEPAVTVTMGLDRPDVAEAFHRTQLQPSGYRIEIRRAALAKGKHLLQIVAITPSPQPDLLAAHRTIIVR